MSHKRSRIIVLLMAGLLLFVSGSSFAGEDTKEPPKTHLNAHGERLQAGYLRASCWSYPSEDEPEVVITNCRDNVARWPRVDKLRAGQKIKIRIEYPDRPDGTIIKAYRRSGEEQGNGRVLAHRLIPVVNSENEIKAWKLVFTVDASGRHYYLDAGAYWDWTAADGHTYRDDAIWSFHVRTRG
jgi:hypothetical protein